MNELLYLRAGRRHILRVVTPVALALSGPLLAGCSADITRFDSPSFAFNDSTGSVDRSSGYGATNLSDQSPGADYGRSYTGPVTSTEPNVRSSRLPDVAENSDNSYGNQRSPYSGGRNNNYADSGYRAPSPQRQYDSGRSSSGQTIVVQSGDTLYGLSRRHGVELAELMSVNGLTSSQLHPGQRLTLPGGASAAPRSYNSPSQTASVQQPSTYSAPTTTRTATQSDWGGSYTVVSGDSLYNIARRHGTTTRELQRHNGISDPRRVMPGTVLRVPGYGSDTSTVAQTRSEPQPQRVASLDNNYTRTDATPSASPAAPSASQSRQVTQPRGVRTVSIAPPTHTQTQSADTSSSASKLRWPVRGRVIDNFGPRSDGTHNDGVNLAVPAGTDVHAAEEGVVAYAGSELRGYGNLILLRHSNGWVTAYAHNDAMNVKRGDKVTRGQVIAKAGKTGQVDQPQLHFELRMGSKPVDPLPYLETL
ncbi:Murein DD-endopeptidase MepM and murein hydrolase activator NlpD, contain LysM domain [Filomicrobium insigne]|uniref:Murein DD-endopeptidase MepM and murein hydrolase activator NlpD, contain LysM domain n=1 Tax=Filomicrobium insigne TaxID=418854 RepID=A0A1H0QDR5_9HYPH|nr:peptidoglycan DD-metalloendopeptidase family protein [Filomicrobium insigne]SDP15195.1 Murein DD-endopeptidase MepM and murein hydrolase activator NlpD, contain LysM domain [Filomicrobium insigne]